VPSDTDVADIRETRTPSSAAFGVEPSSIDGVQTSAIGRGPSGMAAMPRWDWARDAGVPLAPLPSLLLLCNLAEFSDDLLSRRVQV